MKYYVICMAHIELQLRRGENHIYTDAEDFTSPEEADSYRIHLDRLCDGKHLVVRVMK